MTNASGEGQGGQGKNKLEIPTALMEDVVK